MANDMDGLSLDQLRVIAVVAELGSLAAASRHLGRVPSAVTYAVQALEQHLGMTLFDRSGYRVGLNEAGRALLPRIQRILKETAVLRAQAQDLAGGLESEVVLALDTLYPLDGLAVALGVFARRFPTVALRVLVETSAVAARLTVEGTADFGLLVDFTSHDPELTLAALDPVQLVAVAAPHHPLVRLSRPLSAEDVRDHVQLVLSDQLVAPAALEWGDRGILALRTWRVTDLGAKHRLLLEGLGWGSMPRPLVTCDLTEGRLCDLHLDQWDSADGLPRLPAHLVHRRDQPMGPATRWLIDGILAKRPLI